MNHLDNISFWEKLGARIQYKGASPNYVWKILRKPIKKFNDTWQYRVHPDDLKGFHVDIRSWFDGYNNYVTARIYWRGKHLATTEQETGSDRYGEQVAREWLIKHGVQFQYFRDIETSVSSVTVKKKSDL